jgi:hypothetical protein
LVISSALLDLCIRRVGFTEAIVEGGEVKLLRGSLNEFTENKQEHCFYIIYTVIAANEERTIWKYSATSS